MSESTSATVAFFDVDETLVSVKTLESFLRYYLKLTPSMVSPERLRELEKLVLQLDRAEFNRLYFGLWAGQSSERVREAAQSWLDEMSARPDFYRASVLERLNEHRSAGDHIVLVSGSFAPPLEPIAADVAADRLYCTQLEIVDGVYTGRISAAMIGEDKRSAVDAYLGSLVPSADTTWGYGDHSSDLPLLEQVTNPVVVGADPILLEMATRLNWSVIPIDEPLSPRS